jgi:5-methylcytosine-specific restriction protein A
VLCAEEKRQEAATVVDHIEPHRGDMKLFWDHKNWRPLCKRHHDRKTANEDSHRGRDGRWGGSR